MDPEARDRLADLYEGMDREQLAQAGRRHVESDLRQRARRHRRVLWIAGLCLAAVATCVAILVCAYVLEKARTSAERFEHQRDERLRAESADP